MDTKRLEEALENFRKEIDTIYIPEEPRLSYPEEMDKLYDCDIYIWRHKGMGNSMQIISGNKVSIHTATASYLETLLNQKVMTPKDLYNLVGMVIQQYTGKF